MSLVAAVVAVVAGVTLVIGVTMCTVFVGLRGFAGETVGGGLEGTGGARGRAGGGGGGLYSGAFNSTPLAVVGAAFFI